MNFTSPHLDDSSHDALRGCLRVFFFFCLSRGSVVALTCSLIDELPLHPSSLQLCLTSGSTSSDRRLTNYEATLSHNHPVAGTCWLPKLITKGPSKSLFEKKPIRRCTNPRTRLRDCHCQYEFIQLQIRLHISQELRRMSPV
jgi:hypothetical protein